MLHLLSNENTIANQFVAEIRSETIQKDAARFRKNLNRLGQVMAYEVSKTMHYNTEEVNTSLGIAMEELIENEIVLATILRAGLPFHQGFLEYFDSAENAFISAYRTHHKDGSFEIKMEYLTCPDLTGKTLIIADPMLATGASIEATIEALKPYGKPSHIHVATVIASSYGIEYIRRLYPKVHLWTFRADEELTAKSYIVPGLGDAGDLSYGSKSQD